MCYFCYIFLKCDISTKNYKCSAVAEMGDRLVTIDMGRKDGAAVPLSGGRKLGLHLIQCGLS